MFKINEVQGANLFGANVANSAKVQDSAFVNSVWTKENPQIPSSNTTGTKINPDSPYYQVMLDLGYSEGLINSADAETVNIIVNNFLKNDIGYSEEFLNSIDEETKLILLRNEVQKRKNEEIKQPEVTQNPPDKAKPAKKKVIFKSNPSIGTLNQNQENLYFNRAVQSWANMDLLSGNRKTSMYSISETNNEKSKSFRPDKAQTLINTQGDASLSVGGFTKIGQNSSFSGGMAAGQVRTGDKSMLSGAVGYTVESGENSSQLLNANLTEQAYVGDVKLTGSATVQNYSNDNINMTRVDGSVTGAVPIKGNDNSVVWHGGTVYAQGEVAHGSTTFNTNNQTIEGESTLYKGTVGASYNFGTGTFLGDINVGARVSAFNLSETNGIQFGGGVGTPIGLAANFGQIPGYGGWAVTGLSFDNIEIYDGDNVQVTGNISYNSNGWELNRAAHAIDKNVKTTDKEYTFGGGAEAHFTGNDSNLGVQYRSTVTTGETRRDVQAYYSQNFDMSNNMQGRATVALGYGSQQGAYIEGGASFNVGNPTSKKKPPKQDNTPIL